jgi:hypothetical protein
MTTSDLRLIAALACAVAFVQCAAAAPLMCPSHGNQCDIDLALVNGKPAVVNDPIVLLDGKHNVHINWRAPRGWEFMQGGVALKNQAGSPQFDQWCASDTDNDDCASRKPKGRQYHCRAFNQAAGAHAYRLRLRKIGTSVEHEIDPTIINKGS